MKISRKWLNEFAEIDASDKEYDERMTMSGSKVETTINLREKIKNVVVGRVLETVRHENSDHLHVCTVDVGRSEPVTIITGAQNVRAGDLVPTALHKSLLPNGTKIEKGKIRGIKSEGMLCSLSELAMTLADFPYADEDGIFIIQEECKPGEDIARVIGYDDSIVEFEITNNRADCFSVRGLARESAATFDSELRLPKPQVQGSGGDISEMIDVEVEDGELCPRYTARAVRNIRIEPSPTWMRQRLRALGVRPINNIVDITNYVMLEYGQPMHAFDRSYISGGRIIVRRAENGEKLRTLDGNLRELSTDMLLIADEEKAIGIAGVMGGENSEITEQTREIIFESANFNGVSIRKTALKLGIRTESSSRYEKGLDALGTLDAVERACELVELLGAGEVVDGIIDVISGDKATVRLRLEPEKINRLLGSTIERSFMESTLEKLGFVIDGDEIEVPSWRGDIEHYTDLAEEIARYYGYDKIESTLHTGGALLGGLNSKQKSERAIGTVCRALGYSEVMSYTFIGQADYDKIRMPETDRMRESAEIINPLGEDRAIMRTTMLPGILEALARNYSYRNKNVKLYELGRVYIPVEGERLPKERKTLVLAAYGSDTDFYTFKGTIEAMCREMRLESIEYVSTDKEYAYHPGCSALICQGIKVLGVMGQVHPSVAENYGISVPVYAAEVDFEMIEECGSGEAVYEPLPKFPAVLRDLAVICDESVSVGELKKSIEKAGTDLLSRAELFDVYTGTQLAEGKKSVAYSLEFRSNSRNLTEEEIIPIIAKILKELELEHGAHIRDR